MASDACSGCFDAIRPMYTFTIGQRRKPRLSSTGAIVASQICSLLASQVAVGDRTQLRLTATPGFPQCRSAQGSAGTVGVFGWLSAAAVSLVKFAIVAPVVLGALPRVLIGLMPAD